MTKERLVWAIDCDDVVVPSAEAIIASYNERYGTNVSLSAMYDNTNTWEASSHSEVS